MRKLIISSKQAEKLSKIMYNHFKSLKHQPITIEIKGDDITENTIKIISAEGFMEYDLGAEILNQ